MAAPGPEPHLAAGQPPRAANSPRARLSNTKRVRLAGEILASYVQVRWVLRRAPIAAVVDGLRSQSAPTRSGEGTLAEARHLGHIVTRILVLLPGDTRCLARSLVLTRLLARRGIPAKLVIAARRGPDFLAHAWVEHDGIPVLNPGDGSYARLVEL